MVAIYQYLYILIHEHICNVWCGDAMRWHCIILFLFLCAAVAPAAALHQVNVDVATSKDWVIADGTDSSLIIITVTDGVKKPIAGADLVITIDKSTWNVRDPILKTDGSGNAQTLFLPTTKSGTATITVSVTVAGTPVPVTATLVQKIDAGTPYASWRSYPSVATVASTHNITVGVVDRYGNPVTSKRLANSVGFVTTSSGSGGFPDGMANLVKTASVLLNDTGFATIPFRLDTKAGDNFVMITPPSPLTTSLIAITGIGDSIPYSIIQSVSPPGNPPYVMADGVAQASIDYYLYDEWGNPSTDQKILITTSAGEEKTFTTNQDGRATIIYGPKLSAGFYFITATAVENQSVKVFQALQFVSGSPKDMLLTASPQTMASGDVNPNMVGNIIAKVIDEKGNPVKGETVDFRIESSDSAPYPRAKDGDPEIEYGGVRTKDIGARIPIITDGDGQAILNFYPGAFPKNGEIGWNANAQGKVTVSATWVGKEAPVVRSIALSYKNYPFLSVYTDVIPKTVQVGGAVDISVRLKGDGWALQPKPIDVVLCTDRSATMLNNESINSDGRLVVESPNDRMVDAMNAANAFVGQTMGQDRIGLVSFGDPAGGFAVLYDTGNPTRDPYKSPFAWRAGRDFLCVEGGKCKDNAGYHDITDDKIYVNAHYGGHGTTGKDYRISGVSLGYYVESPLTYDKTQITNAINSMVPAGGTLTRRALYNSVKQIVNNPRDGAVRAIILLSDGKWNVGGDPRGIITSPFSVESYPEVPPGPMGTPGTGSVITWAKNNGIKVFTIALVGTDMSDQPNVAEFQAYADETGGKAYVANSGLDLKQIYIDIAGALREEASIDTHVALDFTNVEVNAPQILPGKDVFDYMYIGPDRSTYIVPPLPADQKPAFNDKANWDLYQKFTFDPGTIKINEEWRVNFTLITKVEGNIKVLSSKTSNVKFTGTEGSIDIPDTFITAIPPGKEKGPEGIVFTINFEDPPRTNPDSDKKIASLIWDVHYEGKDTSISQQIWVAPIYSEAYQYKDTLPPLPRAADWDSYNMVISDLRPGQYKVKVIGHVSDANDASDIAIITIPEDVPNAQIRIQ